MCFGSFCSLVIFLSVWACVACAAVRDEPLHWGCPFRVREPLKLLPLRGVGGAAMLCLLPEMLFVSLTPFVSCVFTVPQEYLSTTLAALRSNQILTLKVCGEHSGGTQFCCKGSRVQIQYCTLPSEKASHWNTGQGLGGNAFRFLL